MKNTNKKKTIKGTMSILLAVMMAASATIAFGCTASAAELSNENTDGTLIVAAGDSLKTTVVTDEKNEAAETGNSVFITDEDGNKLEVSFIYIEEKEDGSIEVHMPDWMKDKPFSIYFNDDGSYTLTFLEVDENGNIIIPEN